jgi:uncharacterized membrane protein YdcZ (DUF606 family)
MIAIGIYGLVSRKASLASETQGSIGHSDFANTLAAGFLYLGIPLLLYTISVSRNPVVATNCVIPVVVLGGALLSVIYDHSRKRTNTVQTVLIHRLGAVILVCGIVNVFAFFTSTRDLPIMYRTPEIMAHELNELVLRMKTNNPKVTWLDFNEMGNHMLTLYGYLQYKRLIPYNLDLPYDPPSESEMIKTVSASDIVVVNVKPGPASMSASFNEKRALYLEAIKPTLAVSFKKLDQEYETPFGRYQVYIETYSDKALSSLEKVKLNNPYSDWLATNFTLTILRPSINTLHKAVLTGTSLTYLDIARLEFQVRYIDVEGKALPMQHIVKPTYDRDLYRLEIPIPTGMNVERVLIQANTSFVPRQLGMNSDIRELVLKYPQLVVVD